MKLIKYLKFRLNCWWFEICPKHLVVKIWDKDVIPSFDPGYVCIECWKECHEIQAAKKALKAKKEYNYEMQRNYFLKSLK